MYVSIIALTLVVGYQEGQLADKKPFSHTPKALFQNNWGRKQGATGSSRFTRQTVVKT